jgi:hypothetical protein
LLKRVEVNQQQRVADVFVVNGPASDASSGQSELEKKAESAIRKILESRVFSTE